MTAQRDQLVRAVALTISQQPMGISKIVSYVVGTAVVLAFDITKARLAAKQAERDMGWAKRVHVEQEK